MAQTERDGDDHEPDGTWKPLPHVLVVGHGRTCSIGGADPGSAGEIDVCMAAELGGLLDAT
jgi:hypothetical protein